MSKEKEVLRLLALGLSERMIAASLHVSNYKVSEMRKFCKERNIDFSEALKDWFDDK